MLKWKHVKLVTVVLTTALCVFPELAAGAERAAAVEPLRVLILTGKHNHDWRKTTPALKRIYEDSGRFLVDVTEDPSGCDAETFAEYDVLVSNWTNWPSEEREWGEETEEALLDFVRSGKGFVVFHAGGSSFYDWREFHELIGATWGKGVTGHGPAHKFKVTIADNDHPVTRGVEDFSITDELWHNVSTQPTMQVLATAFSAKEHGGRNKDEPVAICTQSGKGRCFNLVLGHDVEAIEAPGWKTLMLRGSEWAATGKVTIRPVADKPAYSWEQTDTSLALLNHGRVVWRLNYDKSEGKPYFHPICLPDGSELTWLRPPDHPWHRALWFSWKYIDGLNYWEEDPATGLSQGRTETVAVRVSPAEDYSAHVEIEFSYHAPGEPAVLTEKRKLHVTPPDERGRYRIDWDSTFAAGGEDVLLDRTPIEGEPEGESWGGYAGLSVRFAESTSGWQVLDSEGRRGLDGNRMRARWLDLSVRTAGGTLGGIAVLDHPANLRSPAPWYVTMDPAVPFAYFSPAVLYYEPYVIAAGQALRLRYRVLVHPGAGDKQTLEGEWREWREK
jgi:type 1 glutamine amidotransferase